MPRLRAQPGRTLLGDERVVVCSAASVWLYHFLSQSLSYKALPHGERFGM
jgi:hypothetical protein